MNASALTTFTCGDGKRVAIERAQQRRGREELRHLRIEVDQRDRFDLRVAQDLAHRQPVAAAEHQHAPRAGQRRQPGVHQRLVVAVLVARAELQVAVEEQAHVLAPLRDHDALVFRRAGEDDLVRVQPLLREPGEAVGPGEPGGEQRDHAPTCAARQLNGASCARKSYSAQAATSALMRPNRKRVRISPRCGTSTSGNATETASAPR